MEDLSAATLQRRLQDKHLSGSRRHGEVRFVAFEDAGPLAMHFGTNTAIDKRGGSTSYHCPRCPPGPHG
jgi:hypothetical protein